jgi:hypothetical protein
MISHNAIRYTLSHIFQVAGIRQFEESNLDFSNYPDTVKYNHFENIFCFRISNSEQINELLAGTLEMSSIQTADSLYSIPVILPKEFEFCSFNERQIFINADIISISFIMLSRLEETIENNTDIFGNFRAIDSISIKYNFIDFPIVDEYAKLLELNIREYFPNIILKLQECKIIPTHDIDEIFRYSFSLIGFRRIIKDLFFEFNFRTFISTILILSRTIFNRGNDPFLKSVDNLLTFSTTNKLKAEFYFMAAEKNIYNSGYDISNRYLLNTIKKILSAKMIIGLHGGYETRNNPELLKGQKQKLDDCLLNSTIHGRQHYLHFETLNTFETIQLAGIKYDSTMAYNEREGFRSGTCHSYYAWNFKTDSKLNLVIRPLIAMDLTFWQYNKRTINETFDKIIFLFSRCKFVGGDFIINWHNVYVVNKREWYDNVYCKSMLFMKNELNNTNS